MCIRDSTTPGTFQLSTTISGTDINTGLPIPDAVIGSTQELIQVPAAFAAAGLIVPLQVSTGQYFSLFLTVTNTGQAASAVTVPALVNGTGTPVTIISGPTPAGPLTLAGGGAQTFKWTFSPDGAGPLFFSLSAAGTDANNGATVFAGRTITGLVQVRASLAAGLSLSATSVNPGGSFMVRLTLTNTGQASTTGLRPPVL